MVTTWHQRVLALDARYNTQRSCNQPTWGILYIRRRNQLLREKFLKDPEIRTNYLRIRGDLLRQRYGKNTERSISNPSEKEMSDDKIKVDERRDDLLYQDNTFSSVHHVFDQHRAPVTMLKFANNDRSKLCCSSMDGTLSICEVLTSLPKVLAILGGHRKGVTAFDWSISNDLIVSSSLDGTVRLWKVSPEFRPICLRTVNDRQQAEVLCCAFIPINNNLVVAGNSEGMLRLLNVSTGIYTQGGSCKIGGKVLALTCEESCGCLIWASNDKRQIISLRFESSTGRLFRLQKVQETGGIVTSLTWRSWLSRDSPWPALLVNSACDLLFLFHVKDSQGSLILHRKYLVKHRHYPIRSTFCPQTGTCLIASGSEDGSIHLIDTIREYKAARVNRLHGHAVPVLSIAFNYDESLLASADHQGLIILWKKQQRT